MALQLAPFDAADYLDDEQTIAEYLAAALEDLNPDVFLAAVRDVARLRGVPNWPRTLQTVAREIHSDPCSL